MGRGTIRQVVVQPEAGVVVREVPRPVLGPEDVLIEPELVGLCGSDVHALAGAHPFLDGPYVAGHEAVGVVREVGAAVDAALRGTRVVLKPNVCCRACANCRAGRTNACETLEWIGCDTSGARPGALADAVVAPGRNVYPVPDGVGLRDAVLVECLSTPVHATRVAGDLSGARVVVLGAGTIGALAVVAARRAGAAQVVATDVEVTQLERARRLGATAVAVATDEDVVEQVRAHLGDGADAVFDCVASRSSVGQAVRMLRRAGTLLVVGVPTGEVSVPLHLVQDWEITVHGCAAYTEDDVREAIEIAASGTLPTDELISGAYALADVEQAFAAASSPGAGKVLVSP